MPLTTVLALLMSGCTNLGQTPLLPRLQSAAVVTVKQKSVWVPLLSAAVVVLADADDGISDWAVDHTPLFGSPPAADDASDVLVESLMVSALVSSLLAEPDQGNRFKPILVNGLSLVANQKVTKGIKQLAKRKRPTRLSDQSFPSLHSSRAFAAAEITSRNLALIPLRERTRLFLDAGIYTLASTAAWARVEGRAHYPSDMLAGAALGGFIVGVFNEVFLSRNPSAMVSFHPIPHGAAVSLHWQPQP